MPWNYHVTVTVNYIHYYELNNRSAQQPATNWWPPQNFNSIWPIPYGWLPHDPRYKTQVNWAVPQCLTCGTHKTHSHTQLNYICVVQFVWFWAGACHSLTDLGDLLQKSFSPKWDRVKWYSRWLIIAKNLLLQRGHLRTIELSSTHAKFQAFTFVDLKSTHTWTWLRPIKTTK